MVYYNYKGKSVLQKKKDVFFYKFSLQYTLHKLANWKRSLKFPPFILIINEIHIIIRL